MTLLAIIADGGPALECLTGALAGTAGIDAVRRISSRGSVYAQIERLDPALVFIDEPAWTPLPLAVIREARSAAPTAAVIVRAADPTADWLADALMAGATAVLPGVVDEATIGRVVIEVMASRDETLEAARLRWAA